MSRRRSSGTVLVTGTDTGVGKTVVTAAVAAVAGMRGRRVAVVKPAQTGNDDDAGTVRRLAAPATAVTVARYPDPLAPLAAARAAGSAPLVPGTVVDVVRRLADDHDLVLVEGAGGLLVPMGVGDDGRTPWTVADLAVTLGAPALVVARAGLGTLNHTALTVEALARRGLAASVVIGAWPRRPDLVHRSNLTDLARIAPVVGRLPENSGSLSPERFRAAAPDWLDDAALPA